MSFDRNQFKGATVDSLEGEQNRANEAVPHDSNYGNRAAFFKIEDGRNWFRIAPSHDPKAPAYRAKSTTALECEVEETDTDGKGTGKKSVVRKQIFIATTHSTTLKEYPGVGDPVLLYMKYAQDKANIIQDKDERAKFLYPINGWRSKDNTWNWGIKPMSTFVCYAWNSKGVLGRLELYEKIITDMKKVSVSKSPANAPIVPDVFTDPDRGMPLLIDKGKDSKGKVGYTVFAEELMMGEEWAEYWKRNGLTDEQLIDFLGRETLTELYKDVYTTRDFNFAIDGLMRFDTQYKYNIFSDAAFLNELTALKAAVPVYKTNDEKEIGDMFGGTVEAPVAPVEAPAPVAVQNTATPVQAPIPSAPASGIIPKPRMRTAIKQYIMENYGADTLVPELTDEQLKAWYQMTLDGEDLPFAEVTAPVTNMTIPVAPTANVPVAEPAVTANVVETPPTTAQTVSPPAVPGSAVVVESPAISPEMQAQLDVLKRRRGAAKA